MRIVIAGVGLTGQLLVSRLAESRHDIVVIDRDRELCERVSSKHGVVAVHGSATDISTLEEAEIERSNVAVALMRHSADNLAFSILAHSAGVERILARMPNPRYQTAYARAGVTSIIDVTGLFLDRLVLEIERPQMHPLATFGEGRGAVVSVTVAAGAFVVGRPLDEVRSDRKFPRGCAVSAIVRGESDHLLLPTGRDRLVPGDQAILVGTIEGLTRASNLFGARRGITSLFRFRWRSEPASDETLDIAEDEVDSGADANDPPAPPPT